MKHSVSLETAYKLAVQGNSITPFKAVVRFDGECSQPVLMELEGLEDPISFMRRFADEVDDHPFGGVVFNQWVPAEPEWNEDGERRWTGEMVLGPPRPMTLNDLPSFKKAVDLWVPCRKCFSCLRQRSLMWGARAFHETQWSSRTWMLTMTVSPQQRMYAAIAAREKYGDETFSSITKIVGRWFTLYMKRVRKEARVPLRYLLAVERHKDGFPHLHALVHERGFEVGKRLLQKQWGHGFSHCKLADAKSARYVTKYVSKDLECRVRASQRYGRPMDIAKPEASVINAPSETGKKED